MEDDIVGYMYIDLLKSSVLRCLIDWRCLCDRITSEDRGKSDNLRGALIQFCRGQREVFLKLFLLQKFAVMQKKIDKIIENTSLYNQYLQKANDDLCRNLSKVMPTDLVRPCANVSAAIDLLSTGSYLRMPTMMTSLVQSSLKNVIPIPPLDYVEVDMTMERMDIEYRLVYCLSLCSVLPDVSMECVNSRSVLSRDGFFKIVLIYDFFTWQILDVDLDIVETCGYSKDGELKAYFLALLIHKVKNIKGNVYDELYNLTNKFCGKLIMDHLKKQANDYKNIQFTVDGYKYYTLHNEPSNKDINHHTPADNSPPHLGSPGDRSMEGVVDKSSTIPESSIEVRKDSVEGQTDGCEELGLSPAREAMAEIAQSSGVVLSTHYVILDIYAFNGFSSDGVNQLTIRFLLDHSGDVSLSLLGLDLLRAQRIKEYKLEVWLQRIANALEEYQLSRINHSIPNIYMNYTNGALHIYGHRGFFNLNELNTVRLLLTICDRANNLDKGLQNYSMLHQILNKFWTSGKICAMCDISTHTALRQIPSDTTSENFDGEESDSARGVKMELSAREDELSLTSDALYLSLTDGWYVLLLPGGFHGVVYKELDAFGDLILGSLIHAREVTKEVIIVLKDSTLSGIINLGQHYNDVILKRLDRPLKAINGLNFVYITEPFTEGDELLILKKESSTIEINLDGKFKRIVSEHEIVNLDDIKNAIELINLLK